MSDYRPKIINIMDSSLKDLETKGVFSSVGRIYNPNHAFSKVFHFTPHLKDLDLAPSLAPDKIELVHHPVSGLSPFKLILTIFKMWKLIKKNDIELIRGRLPYLGSLMGAIAARLARKPFVVSLGGDNRIVQEKNGIYNYNSKFFSYLIEQIVLQLSTSIIVPNQYTYNYVSSLIGEKKSKEKSVIIPWISDPIDKQGEAISDPRILTIPSSRRLMIIVGFLNRYKFTDVLYKTLEAIINDSGNEDVQFVFCGDGPLREEGERLFLNSTQVTFLGWTDKKLVQQLMRKAEVILIPMSGFVLLEAASLGKPIITSNVEWHSEMVQDGITGLVVTPDDVEAWKKAIQEMLDNPIKAQEYGEKIEKLYFSQYAPDITIQAEKTLYTKLMEAPKT